MAKEQKPEGGAARKAEDRELDRAVIEATGARSLTRERRLTAEDSERMWHRRWLLQYGAVVVVLLVIVGGIFWSVYRSHSDERAAGKITEEQIKQLTDTTNKEIDDLISQGKVSEAIVALEAAVQKGLPQDVFVDLDKKVKTALATATTTKVRNLISQKQFGTASNELQNANENGLPRAKFLDLDKEVKDALAEVTRADVRDRLARHEYGDAERVLEKARQNGLPHEISVDIEGEIAASGRECRAELLRKEAEARRNMDSEAAEKLLAQAEALNKYAQEGNVDEIREAQGKTLIEQSRKAASKGEWQRAIDLLEKARQKPVTGDALAEWDRELRAKVGGRLVVKGTPDKAVVKLAGGKVAKIGEVISGIDPGTVEFVVSAEGYIPQFFSEYVDFPALKSVNVRLTQEAPGPIWALTTLTGHPFQRLAAHYYLRTSKDEKWDRILAKFANADPPKDKNNGKKKAKESAPKPNGETNADPADDVGKAIAKFTNGKDHGLIGLDRLAAATLGTPKALELVLADKDCLAAIRDCLARIEKGCANCAGQGNAPCAACQGKGKRREAGPCLDCGATGQRTCSTCKGSTKLKCKTCKGSGKVIKQRSVPGRALKQTYETECDPCKGTGRIDCGNCRGGKVTCTKCKGVGQYEGLRPCSACNGQGTLQCTVCGGTGDREQMAPERRRACEDEIRRRGDED